jgi:hypothetical protein
MHAEHADSNGPNDLSGHVLATRSPCSRRWGSDSWKKVHENALAHELRPAPASAKAGVLSLTQRCGVRVPYEDAGVGACFVDCKPVQNHLRVPRASALICVKTLLASAMPQSSQRGPRPYAIATSPSHGRDTLNRPGPLCRGTGSSFERNDSDPAYPAPGATHLRTPRIRVVSDRLLTTSSLP